jgi:hypothetical protein
MEGPDQWFVELQERFTPGTDEVRDGPHSA